ncbi:hypothetical protein H0E84_12350 [Luteimonas sp. SJ-92]|uniref:Lipoprotein n=1 Tax=Luteimonas salinisoli TaxID=2752307 RepID=A0A853JEL1_9GAMM|nr:hypothetical protein [Luteimonas salinisoli]NZA27172.1 hypothetical protein [Luteimonas salinisoli]
MIPRTLALALLLSTLALGACSDPEAEAQARAEAQAAAAERAAGEAAAGFDAAVAEENWALAKAQADVLLARWPDTEVAARVRGEFDAVKAKADAIREDARAAALWQYNVQEVKGGQQRSAAIFARDDVDTDGSGAKQVRLIFRDHPSWGRSSYLVLQAGDFACGRACRVPVSVDDGEPRRMAANRPVTDEAIAMFIEDEAALWRMTEGAKTLSIEFPVKAGGTRTAVFEVAGLDRARMPGWD